MPRSNVVCHIPHFQRATGWLTNATDTYNRRSPDYWMTDTTETKRKIYEVNNKLPMIIHSSFYFLLLCFFLTFYDVITSDIAVLFTPLMGGPWPVTLWLRYFPQCVNVAKELTVTEQRQKSGRELPASSHTVAGQKGVKILLLWTAERLFTGTAMFW